MRLLVPNDLGSQVGKIKTHNDLKKERMVIELI